MKFLDSDLNGVQHVYLGQCHNFVDIMSVLAGSKVGKEKKIHEPASV